MSDVLGSFPEAEGFTWKMLTVDPGCSHVTPAWK